MGNAVTSVNGYFRGLKNWGKALKKRQSYVEFLLALSIALAAIGGISSVVVLIRLWPLMNFVDAVSGK